MGNNKFLKLHSLLRMLAAVLAIVVFISMFAAKQAQTEAFFFDFDDGFFFNDSSAGTHGNWIAFIAYILVLVGGLAGLAFVFIDELIGKDLTKKLAFVAGGVALLGGVLILLSGVLFRAFNSDCMWIEDLKLCAGPIVFGILAVLVGGIGIAAPILEDKGF